MERKDHASFYGFFLLARHRQITEKSRFRDQPRVFKACTYTHARTRMPTGRGLLKIFQKKSILKFLLENCF